MSQPPQFGATAPSALPPSALPLSAFARDIASGRPVIAAWCGLPEPTVPGLLAREAFDAIAIDMQHAPVDLRAVVSAIPLVAAAGKPTIVRVPVDDFATVSRVLDAGAAGIVAPMIDTAEDARRLVAFAKFPPVGGRSWGPAGALALTGMDHATYFAQANDITIVLAMIETRAALDAIDDILAVEGLDGIFIGPADLSVGLSQGARLDPEGAQVDEAMRHAIARTRAAGKRIGVFAASPARGRAMVEMGFDLVALGSDTMFMQAGARAALTTAKGE